MADVLDMVRAQLIAGGYDGLYCPGECACLVDDLAPCDEINSACEAGYREDCDEDCTHEGAGDTGWHLADSPRDPRAKKQPCHACGNPEPITHVLAGEVGDVVSRLVGRLGDKRVPVALAPVPCIDGETDHDPEDGPADECVWCEIGDTWRKLRAKGRR